MSTKNILKVLENTVRTWKSELPVTTTAMSLFEKVDSPTSLGLYLCVKYGDILSLVSHKVHPSDYIDSPSGLHCFQWDYQCCSLLAKYPFSGVCDTRSKAIEASRESELSCSKANDRIQDWLDGRLSPSFSVSEAILLAKSRVKQILGPFDPLEWASSCRFGPGVTCEDKSTSSYDKLSEILGVNPAGYQLAISLMNSSKSWVASLFKVDPFDFVGPLPHFKGLKLMDYGMRAYVPKNALTDRPIEIQPGLSGYMQLGIGACIRRRLHDNNVDLDMGWKRNAELARIGSLDNSIVTADLKSASDSICYSLVNWIIPPDWLAAMVSCRPRFLLDEGTLIETERFSSMGNGYTFELESLIFFSLAWASTVLTSGNRHHVAVFGDDIAVPTVSYPLMHETFSFLGFQMNHRKTFSEGPFRESCGKDWFLGVDVSPLRITRKVDNVSDTIELANRIRRYACNHGLSDHMHSYWRPLWLRVVKHLPSSVRRSLAGPPDLYGDGWLHSDQDSFLANPLYAAKRRWGYDRQWIRVPRVTTSVPSRSSTRVSTVLATMLYTSSLRRALDSEAILISYRSAFSREAALRHSRLRLTSGALGEVVVPPRQARIQTHVRMKWIPLHTPLTSVWI